MLCNTQNSALLISRVKCHWIQSLCRQESPKCWQSSIGVQNIYFYSFLFLFFFFLSSLWILYECPDLRMRRGRHLGGGDRCVQVFHRAAVCLQHVTVQWRCNKSATKNCSNSKIKEGYFAFFLIEIKFFAMFKMCKNGINAHFGLKC